MENEDGWDYNAPKFIDFSRVDYLPDDDNADKYFDYDHENGMPVDFGMGQDKSLNGTPTTDLFSTPQSEIRRVTRASTKTPKNETPKTRSRSTPQRAAKSKTPETQVAALNTPEVEASKDNSEKDNTPTCLRETRSGKNKTPNTVEKAVANKTEKTANNICSSMDEWRKKTAGAKQAQNSKTGQKDEDRPNTDVKETSKRQHRSLDRSEKHPKRQKPDGDHGNMPAKGSGVKRASSFCMTRNRSIDTSSQKKHTRGLSGDRSLRSGSNSSIDTSGQKKHTRGLSGDRSLRSGSNSSEPERSHKPAVMTVPTTPTFMKRKPVKLQSAAVVKNSEELEMEKIAYYRQELAKKRKQAQESYKTALTGKGPTCAVMTKEPTRPEAFKFETDSRIKTHGMETRNDMDVKDFTKILRSDKGKPMTSGPMKAVPTRPEPFKLTEQRKRKLGDLEEKQAEKYESMAQRLAAFSKTPDRFRSRPKAGPSTEKRGRSKSPPLTVPKTPNFETRTRGRPVNAPTREDQERQEIEEAQKHQFKAQPVNQKIFQNPSTGIRKVPSKPSTKPEEFHLSSNVKTHERETKREEHFEFHAKPLNKKMLEGPVGIKEPKRLPITQPESPAFALKHRARIPVIEEPQETGRPNLRNRPAPHFGLPFQPHLHHKATEPEPFAFDERDKKRADIKAKKIEQVYEEENKHRIFHAQPLPDHEPHLPPKKAKPLTVQRPFNLDTDLRGAKKTAEWSKKLEDELHEQKEKARFYARNPTVLEQEPFVPQKENKHTTDISEFELSTAKRLVKREAYEMSKKARQDKLDSIRLQEERMRQAEEKAELERMRREAVHKANPVKHYKLVAIKASDKPVTEPMSPKFKTDTRLRTRAAHAESFMSE